MSRIGERIAELRAEIEGPGIDLIVVTKQRTLAEIEEAYAAGERRFGESRVHELLEKKAALPDDIEWHLIGTLQRKKVAKVVGEVALIHSVDALELAQKIASVSEQKGVISHVLLEANVSGEASKHGLPIEQWLELLPHVQQLPNLSVDGLMTMAPLTDDREVIRRCFERLRDALPDRMYHLSMGMSHDWREAVDAGATLLRIGTSIFE